MTFATCLSSLLDNVNERYFILRARQRPAWPWAHEPLFDDPTMLRVTVAPMLAEAECQYAALQADLAKRMDALLDALLLDLL